MLLARAINRWLMQNMSWVQERVHLLGLNHYQMLGEMLWAELLLPPGKFII